MDLLLSEEQVKQIREFVAERYRLARQRGAKHRFEMDNMEEKDFIGAAGEAAANLMLKGRIVSNKRGVADPGYDIITPDGRTHSIYTAGANNHYGTMWAPQAKKMNGDYCHKLQQISDRAYQYVGWLTLEEWILQRRVTSSRNRHGQEIAGFFVTDSELHDDPSIFTEGEPRDE